MLRVLGNRVLIRRIDEDVPESKWIEVVHTDESHPSQFAIVCSLGAGWPIAKGTAYLPFEFSVGDKVVTQKYCGTPVQIENETLYIVMGDDILARIG